MTPYAALADMFCRHEDEVLEIEVLLTGQTILQDGLCIGVPKKLLAAAFMEARNIFTKRNEPGSYPEVRT